MSKKKTFVLKDKRNEKQKMLDSLKIQRKISREIELESGIRHRSVVFNDKTKYDRRRSKDQLRKALNEDN